MTGPDLIALHGLLDAAGVPVAEAAGLAERVRWLCYSHDRLLAEADERHARPTRDRLLAMLDEDRPQVLLLLADDALDRGEEAEAKAWHYIGARGKWPVKAMSGWGWMCQHDGCMRHSCDLGRDLWLVVHGAISGEVGMIRGPTRGPMGWRTQREALEAVVGAIAGGKWKGATK